MFPLTPFHCASAALIGLYCSLVSFRAVCPGACSSLHQPCFPVSCFVAQFAALSHLSLPLPHIPPCQVAGLQNFNVSARFGISFLDIRVEAYFELRITSFDTITYPPTPKSRIAKILPCDSRYTWRDKTMPEREAPSFPLVRVRRPSCARPPSKTLALVENPR